MDSVKVCTAILAVIGLALAGPLPLASDCAVQSSCCCPHEAPDGPRASADAASECCDVADGTPPSGPVERELPPRQIVPAAAVARPTTDRDGDAVQTHVPRRLSFETDQTHLHARLSVFLI